MRNTDGITAAAAATLDSDFPSKIPRAREITPEIPHSYSGKAWWNGDPLPVMILIPSLVFLLFTWLKSLSAFCYHT
jgi:hypothetical protein